MRVRVRVMHRVRARVRLRVTRIGVPLAEKIIHAAPSQKLHHKAYIGLRVKVRV